MDYTIEEKDFIIKNHPEIEIEDIRFEYVKAKGEDGGHIEDCGCFLSEEAYNLYCNKDEDVDGVMVNFNFRDHGPKLSEKHIEFCGAFSICDNLITDHTLRCDVPGCKLPPSLTFSVMADSDGRFFLSVPVLFRKTPENNKEKLFQNLKKHNAMFMIHYVVIANQFASEKIEYIMGRIPNAGERTKFWITRAVYDISDISKKNDLWADYPEKREDVELLSDKESSQFEDYEGPVDMFQNDESY